MVWSSNGAGLHLTISDKPAFTIGKEHVEFSLPLKCLPRCEGGGEDDCLAMQSAMIIWWLSNGSSSFGVSHRSWHDIKRISRERFGSNHPRPLVSDRQPSLMLWWPVKSRFIMLNNTIQSCSAARTSSHDLINGVPPAASIIGWLVSGIWKRL